MALDTYFTPAQIAALQAAFDRIIPTDEFPGAWQAGVGDYLAQQFARDLADALPLYQAGLAALDAEAMARFGCAFVQLGPAQKNEVLTDIERGDVQTDWPIAPRRFFETMVNHAAEGFYGDPGNGGNHNETSWQMIGFPDRR